MAEFALEWLKSPITDNAEISRLNALCAELNINPLTSYIKADMANLNAVSAANMECFSCTKKDRNNCYKYLVKIIDGRVKAVKVLCNINQSVAYIKSSGIPGIFQSCRIADFNVTPDNRAVVEVVEESLKSGKGFFIYGHVGTGKTMLCSLYIIERAFLGKPSLFYTVTDMFKDLKEFDNPLARSEKERKIKSCPCLVIDDLGAEYVSDWVSSKLFEILDSRYKNNLTTVINSNLAIGDINNRYIGIHGSRIARRIEELCTLCWLPD